MPTVARFPTEWLDPRATTPATDLDLAVLLVNSYDALAEPPDRLEDLRWVRAAFSQVGHEAIARSLRATQLAALRRLREDLRTAFEASDALAAARILNPLMTTAHAVPALVVDAMNPMQARLETAVGAKGLAALQGRLPVALARHITEHGADRLSTCASDPCHCVFVDRTRAGTRRYCCGWCNDRAAARAYRRRRRA